MVELTLGQLRTIQESTQSWRMLLANIEGAMGEVPKDVKKKIDALQEGFINAFGEYYTQSIEANDGRNADDVASDFAKIWSEKHPEFYDVRAIFSGCGEDALRKAEKAISYAESILA